MTIKNSDHNKICHIDSKIIIIDITYQFILNLKNLVYKRKYIQTNIFLSELD